MPQKGPWKVQSNGVYLTQSGEICMLVEKVGARFRVLVTRMIGEMGPEEIVYAGSAASVDDAMRTAERAAETASDRVAA
jgi:hypothetical protein